MSERTPPSDVSGIQATFAERIAAAISKCRKPCLNPTGDGRRCLACENCDTYPEDSDVTRRTPTGAEREWVDLFATRDEIAEEYGVLLRRWAPADERWRSVNEAIIDRWSANALDYVKRRAWKIAETGRP